MKTLSNIFEKTTTVQKPKTTAPKSNSLDTIFNNKTTPSTIANQQVQNTPVARAIDTVFSTPIVKPKTKLTDKIFGATAITTASAGGGAFSFLGSTAKAGSYAKDTVIGTIQNIFSDNLHTIFGGGQGRAQSAVNLGIDIKDKASKLGTGFLNIIGKATSLLGAVSGTVAERGIKNAIGEENEQGFFENVSKNYEELNSENPISQSAEWIARKNDEQYAQYRKGEDHIVKQLTNQDFIQRTARDFASYTDQKNKEITEWTTRKGKEQGLSDELISGSQFGGQAIGQIAPLVIGSILTDGALARMPISIAARQKVVTAVMTGVENSMNTQQVFEANMSEGKGVEDSYKKASNFAYENFLKGYAINQFTGIFERSNGAVDQAIDKVKKITIATKAKDFGLKVLNYVKTAAGEGIEEMTDQLQQNQASGKPISEGVADSFWMGVIGGSIAPGIHKVADIFGTPKGRDELKKNEAVLSTLIDQSIQDKDVAAAIKTKLISGENLNAEEKQELVNGFLARDGVSLVEIPKVGSNTFNELKKDIETIEEEGGDYRDKIKYLSAITPFTQEQVLELINDFSINSEALQKATEEALEAVTGEKESIPRLKVESPVEAAMAATKASRKIIPEHVGDINDFIDLARVPDSLGKITDEVKVELETTARSIAEYYGIDPDVSNAVLANRLEKLLDRTSRIEKQVNDLAEEGSSEDASTPNLKTSTKEYSDAIGLDLAKEKIDELFDEHEVQLFTGENLDNMAQKGNTMSILRGFHQPKRVVADLIALVERNGKVSNATLYHEAFHAYLDNFVSPAEKARAINYIIENHEAEIRRRYSDEDYPTLEDKAEEYAADEFAEYVRTRKTEPKLRNFFQRILDRIERWIRGKKELDNLYDRILKKDRSTVNPKAAAKKRSLKVEDNRTPQEILADAEAKAANTDKQSNRISKLKDLVQSSRSHQGFIDKIENDPEFADIMPKLDKDLRDNGYQNFSDFYVQNKPKKVSTTTKTVAVEKPVVTDENYESELEQYDEHIAYLKESLDDHPGAKLQKFMSKKDSEFQDFKNPDLAKTPSERAAIETRNVKVIEAAQSAFENTADRENFDNPDTIRAAIADYKSLQAELKVVQQEQAALKKNQKAPKAIQENSEATAKMSSLLSQTTQALEQDQTIPETTIEDLRDIAAQINPIPDTSEEYISYTDSVVSDPKDVNESNQLFKAFEFADVPPSNEIFGELTEFPTSYSDISGFVGQTRDFFRNIRSFFPKANRAKVEELIIDPFDAAKGKYVDMNKELSDRLYTAMVEKFDIKRGSAEDAAIMNYGERNLQGDFAPPNPMDEYKLIAEFGAEKAKKIIAADAWFRDQYDRLVDQINAIRKELYKGVWEKKANLDKEIEILQSNIDVKQKELAGKKNTNTLTYNKLQRQIARLEDSVARREELLDSELWWRGKLVPKRNDYYRHFRELAEGFIALKNIITEDASISSTLAGISPNTKPKAKWLKFAQKRTGNNSERSAIGGFLDYIPAASYAVNIDPQITRFRQLAKEIAEKTVDTKNANNFLENLADFTNHLAGKSNEADRYIQKITGRKIMRGINWANARIKANMILGNLSSSIAQIFNVPQGIGSAKQHSIGGIKRTFAQIFSENEPMNQSSFIKERYAKSITDKFDEGILHNTKKFAVWITGALDEVGTKFIWNSHYQQAIAEGIENPVRFADNKTRGLVAGRGIGEKPLIQNSKIFQLVAPFQLEVGNLWWAFQDEKKEKGMAGLLKMLAIYAVTAFLMNKAAEEIRGNDVVFDPIQATIDGIKAFQKEENKGVGTVKFFGRLSGEVLSNVPLGQTLAGIYPEDGFAFLGKITREELFGGNDPTRFGSGILVGKELADPIFKLLPPFGGGQIKKTYEGVRDFVEGEVQTGKGKKAFEVDKTPVNAAKMALFGKYSTKEARDYFDGQEDIYDLVNKQDKESVQKTERAQKEWEEISDLYSKSPEEAIARIQEIAAEDPTIVDKIADLVEEESLGLTQKDRAIKQLGVQNGQRAKYIADQISKLDSTEEQIAYIQELSAKKLITDDIVEQITEIIANE